MIPDDKFFKEVLKQSKEIQKINVKIDKLVELNKRETPLERLSRNLAEGGVGQLGAIGTQAAGGMAYKFTHPNSQPDVSVPDVDAPDVDVPGVDLGDIFHWLF